MKVKPPRHFVVATVGLIAVQSALAFYNPSTGRWLSRDPVEEYGGGNLYGFAKNNCLSRYDVQGLWGSEVHHDYTFWWAVDGGYPAQAAQIIAFADTAVDSGKRSPMPWGDQSYHFNRNLGGGLDTRWLHANEHTLMAQNACDIGQGHDDPVTAAIELGTGLHPVQDWVAHGDYFIWWAGPITEIHNAYSLQDLPAGWPAAWKLPDTIWLDAVDGPGGRPAGRAMIIYSEPGQMRHGYAVYWYGRRRFDRTHELTSNRLAAFRSFVAVHGGCRCRAFFGVH